MEFGNRSSFAITIALDENHGGTRLFGHMCYWVNGQQVGSFDETVSLGDVLTAMTWIVGDCGSREHCELFKSTSDKNFRIINNALYCGEGPEQVGVEAMSEEETPARFDISIAVTTFNGWKTYLVECGDEAKILYRQNGGDIQEFVLPRGEFDAAIKATQQLIEVWDAQVVAREESRKAGGP